LPILFPTQQRLIAVLDHVDQTNVTTIENKTTKIERILKFKSFFEKINDTYRFERRIFVAQRQRTQTFGNDVARSQHVAEGSRGKVSTGTRTIAGVNENDDVCRREEVTKL